MGFQLLFLGSSTNVSCVSSSHKERCLNKMSCLPFIGWRTKKSEEAVNSGDDERIKRKYFSRRKMRESIESLPKQDLFERIYHWLENNENDSENYFYNEESDDQDYEVRFKLKNTKLKDLHPIKIQEEYLQGGLMQKVGHQQFTLFYHSNIPPTTLV